MGMAIGIECRLIRLVHAANERTMGVSDRQKIMETKLGSGLSKIGYTDAHPILLASNTSLADLNRLLVENGKQGVLMNRFRPNVIVNGDEPWGEDVWAWMEVKRASGEPLTLVGAGRKGRCKLTTVQPEHGAFVTKQNDDGSSNAMYNEPLETLRRVRSPSAL